MIGIFYKSSVMSEAVGGRGEEVGPFERVFLGYAANLKK